MTHKIDTTKYELKHKRKPVGDQCWIFIYDGITKSSYHGIYPEAEKAALRFRKQGCYESVQVQE